MSVRDAELEFEVNDTYWLDELDAELAFEFEEDFLPESDWAIGDDEDEYYDEDDDYDDFADWEIDLLDDEV